MREHTQTSVTPSPRHAHRVQQRQQRSAEAYLDSDTFHKVNQDQDKTTDRRTQSSSGLRRDAHMIWDLLQRIRMEEYRDKRRDVMSAYTGEGKADRELIRFVQIHLFCVPAQALSRQEWPTQT